MANYIKSDLDFILAQIKIAEAHAEAMKTGADPRTSLLQLIGNAPNLSFGLRTVDGSLNNLVAGQTEFGQADQAFPRLTTPYYLDEQDGDMMSFGPGGTIINTDYGTNGNVADADPRTISNLIVTQDVSNPAAIRAALKAAGVEGTAQTAATNAISAAYKATLNANGANAEVEAATAVVSGASADASAAVAALNAATALQLSYTAGVTMATGVPSAISAAQTAAENLITALNDMPGEPVPVPPFTLTEPVQADYVVTADFNTAHAQWVDAAPTDAEPLATDFPGVAAFETAHAQWVEAQVAHAAKEPDPADFPDSTTFEAEHAEWDAVAPIEPLATDFPDVAAFETAHAQWVEAQETHAAAEPLPTAFPDVAAFDAAHDQWATAQAAHAAAETQYQTDLVAFDNATIAATDAFDAAMAAASSAVTAAGAVVTALGDNPTDGAQTLEALANDLRTAIEGIEEGGFVPADAATITSALGAFNGAPALAQSNIGELTTLRNNAGVDRATAQVAADEATAAFDAANDDLAIAQAAANTAGTPEGTADALQGLLDDFGLQTDENGGLVIENRAPDEGLSAPFNSWMTLFGQFFDHGLDLVTKGGNGTIYMPLQPDDPLYVEGSNTNFMALTRASIDTQNQTTPHVDQNQTYSSHPSHQVFLREWVPDGSGKPVETGKLITGSNGGMATWADVKVQARDILGIELDDADVLAVPALITDLYGNAEMGPNGFPQVVMADGTTKEGDPNDPVDATFAAKTGHAFLVDIAHNAVPGTVDHDRNPATPDIEITPDNDGIPDSVLIANGFGINEQYDNELLDAHFMAGDGRVNENIGLTAVHHIFHSEHNRLVDYSINQVIMPAMVNETGTPEEAAADLAFLNEWLRVKLPDGTDPATVNFSTLQWDGARLFQLAKFGTEMQYQHLVFEDFARKMQPQIDVFLAPVGYDTTIDPSILAEFAHTVYRFGHSMLTETIDRLDPSFNAVGADWSTQDAEQIGLIEAFLNPIEYNKGGEIHADMAAGAVVRGMTRQVGNEIDEFVTDALRSNLLGLPLDLAAINLARGRDTAIPTLNMAREQFYTMTGDTQLKPYESWFDFTLNIKNPASVVNFIAAYGTHATLDDAGTLAEKRDAAMKLVFGGDDAPLDRQAFLNGTGSYAGDKGGLDKVDFWIGGLAEAIAPFGGMLGSTFNFVFETQLEALQDGDRFYYLARTASMNFLAELENNSFASMIVDNTDATHLPIDVFATPSYVLEVDQTKQYNHGMGSDDPFEASLFDPEVNKLVIRANENSLQFTGGDHVVLGGTDDDDTLIAGIGDDSIWGDGGNDRIEGGHGNDNIDGGAGDDIITDLGGDDVIKGNDGNDVIHGGPGGNLIIGGRGSDFIITGEDFSEVFAGPGNDFILGTTTNEAPIGGEGDDWFEGGSQDGAMGDNSDAFGADTIAGHDVFFGRDGFNEFVAEGGDDIMVSSVGITRNEGMSGFDWVSYIGRSSVYADLNLPAFDETPIPPDENTALDRYEAVEGLSGSHGNDVLIGSEETDLGAIPPAEPVEEEEEGGVVEEAPLEPAANGQQGSVLTAAGIARIDGLQELLGTGVTEFRTGNIILGGGGSDRIEGLGGDDIIDGDSYLNVRIARQGTNETWKTMVGDLQKRMLAGEINPSELYIVREILPGGKPGDIDTAVYAGQAIDYAMFTNAAGTLTVMDMNPDDGDTGSDQLHNIERIEFSDQTIVLQGDPPTPVDVVLSIADAPTRIETGDTGPTNLAFGLSLDDTSFSGNLRVVFNVGAVTGQAQIVSFVNGLGTLTLPVVNDNVDNGTDTRVITLTGATGIGAAVTLGATTASGMVTEDDATAILLSITNAPTLVEVGDTGTTNLAFGLSLNDIDFNGDLDVSFDTGTAGGQTETVNFVNGLGTLTVPVDNDDVANGTEMVAVTLTGASGIGATVTLGATTASGMVTEDDGTALVLSVADAPTLVEVGDIGITNLAFGLSVDVADFSGNLEVSFGTGTATNQTQTVNFVNGAGTLIVPVDNDDVDNGAEMVGVTLTGATGTGVVATLGTATANGMVTEDDVIPVLLSIANAPMLVETGDTGTTDLAFGLSLDDTNFSGDLVVSFDTGAATGQTRTVNFVNGIGTLTMSVANDDVDDGDEMVAVTLTGATGTGVAVTLGTATASGTVTEDDVAPPPVDVLLSIANAPTLAEAGDTGTTDLAFGLSLDDTNFSGDLVVSFDTGAATGQTRTVNFMNGIGTLTMSVANDDVDDGDEMVAVTLTGATGTGVAVTLGTATASGTVTEDDVAAPPPGGSVLPIDFSANPLLSYSNQDRTPDGAQIDPDGAGITLSGNIWKKTLLPGGTFTVDADTVLRFDVTMENGTAEFVSIGLENDDDYRTTDDLLFQVFGSINIARFDQSVRNDYTTVGQTVSYEIPLAAHAGRTFDYLALINDDDAAQSSIVRFSNVELVQGSAPPPPPPTGPVLSITDALTVAETGDTGTTDLDFGLSLSDAGFTGTLQVTYNAGSATNQTQAVSFAGGIGTLTVQVPNDDLANGPETVPVTLTGASGTATPVTLGTATASGTVTEDDVAAPPPGGSVLPIDFSANPLLSYSNQDRTPDGAQIDPDGAGITLSGNIWKKTLLPGGTFTVDADTVLRFDVTMENGTAEFVSIGLENDDDYRTTDDLLFQVFGSINIARFDQSVRNDYTTVGQTVSYEIPLAAHAGRTFDYLALINDDDAAQSSIVRFSNVELVQGSAPPPPPPTGPVLSITDALTVAETGDTGTTDLDFGLSLSDAGFTGTLQVTYNAGSATNQTQAVSFAGGIGTLTVQVPNDDLANGPETVPVTLTGASGTATPVTLGTATASGTVTEDDVAAPPASVVLSIADAPTLTETGDTGTTDLAFGLNLSDTSFSGSLQVAYDTGTATSQSVSFVDGIGMLTVSVANDDVDNGTETVTVTLTGASGTATPVTLGTATASGMVTEDDVTGGGGTVSTIVTAVGASSDDWEQFGGGSSNDLEFGLNGSRAQAVGMRFDGIDISQTAIITDAYLQFTSLETSSGAANFTIGIQGSENAATFSSGAPPQSRVIVDEFAWANVEQWTAGTTYRTPDISELIETVIGADGATNAALAFIVEGTGSRVASSFNNGDAPELVLVLDDGSTLTM